MIYAIKIEITANQGIMNAALNALTSRDDSKVWKGNEHNGNTEEYFADIITEDGEPDYLDAYIPFITEADRDSEFNKLKLISGLLNSCDDGSKVELLPCDHDIENRTGDKVEKAWIKENGEVETIVY